MASSAVSITYLAPFAYRTCKPNEWLVKTGLAVNGELFLEKTYQWPMQRVTCLTLAPRNYAFNLNCVSKDLVPFELPVVFTCGPYDPEISPDDFRQYARRMATLSNGEIQHTVCGVIHGQTRLYAASMTVMEMFNDRDAFKVKVQERIEKELKSFGLQVFNGNIAEMRDKEGSSYFESLKQKAISGATNAARVATANANKVGDVGEWQRRSETMIEKKEIDAQQASSNNKQDESIQRSNLELEKVKIDCEQQLKMKQVEADMAPRQRKIENDTQLERLDAVNQQESLRAKELAQTIVESERIVKEAGAQAEAQKLQAEAQKYASQQAAEANFYRRQKESEADLYAQQKKAEGIKAVAKAQADGLKQLAQCGSPELVQFYLGIDTGFFDKMAQNSASAIKGLQPKINVWNTGAQTDTDGAATYSPLRNLFASIPPIADAMESQAGIQMPKWMAHKPAAHASGDHVQVATPTNGHA